MIWGRIGASLSTKILVIILKEKFRRLMGLKSLKVEGFGHLAMRAIRNDDDALRSLPVPKKFYTTATTELPTIS